MAVIWSRLFMMPATNAASEMLYSAPQHIKIYIYAHVAVSELFDTLARP